MQEKIDRATRAGRSPSYPAFGLPTAIEKLKAFHPVQRNNAVSVESALESLGYKSTKSGGGQRALAALISFGPLSEEGMGQSRRVKATDLGRNVLRAIRLPGY